MKIEIEVWLRCRNVTVPVAAQTEQNGTENGDIA